MTDPIIATVRINNTIHILDVAPLDEEAIDPIGVLQSDDKDCIGCKHYPNIYHTEHNEGKSYCSVGIVWTYPLQHCAEHEEMNIC